MRHITDRELVSWPILADEVKDESSHQRHKWGVQSRTPAEWMMYLTEEIGELAEAISECEYRGAPPADVHKEAIQVATLALKIAEMYR